MVTPKSEKTKERLLQLMQQAKGNELDIYYVIYDEFLRENEEAPALLPVIFEYSAPLGVAEPDASEKVSPELARETAEQYGEYLRGTVAMLAKNNDSEEEFYKKLWDGVFCSATAPQETAQRAVVLKLLNEENPLLPYYQASGLFRMENEEFSRRITELQPKISEAVHMLNRHFQQRTEETSQLCRISASLSEEDSFVYWAALLQIVRKNSLDAGYARGRAKREQEEREKE